MILCLKKTPKIFNVFMIIIEKYETYQKRINSGNYFIKVFTILRKNTIYSFTDIDECKDNTHKCHRPYGICTNTIGSYRCHCKTGFRGDGRICRGNRIIKVLFVLLSG